MKTRSGYDGFSLVELMIVVAIAGTLMAIAMPMYSDYVIRAKIPDATSGLSNKRTLMEQYFQDNRTYVGAPACAADPSSGASPTSKYYDFTCVATATTFTITATGVSSMAGFAYTIDQNGTKGSTITASGWAGTSTSCWITAKGGTC